MHDPAPVTPPATLPGNQFSTLPEVISGTNQPLVLNLPAQGWISNANAIGQLDDLLEEPNYIRLVNNAQQSFGANRQQSAIGDFLSLYSITRDNGVEANGRDDLRLINNDARVREALFGNGTAGGSLISQVHIGGVGSQNAYTNLSSVLTNLEIQNTPAPFHQNHFHVYLRVPTLQPIVGNLLSTEGNPAIAISVPFDGNSATVRSPSDTAYSADFEEEVVRNLLVTALLASTSSGSMVPVAAQSAEYYENSYTTCQDVQNLSVESAYNDFYPVTGVISAPPPGKSVKDWAVETNVKIIQVESPKHGSVKVVDSAWYQYRFVPDKDYLGKDRVVYEIEQQGKRYKVTINFWIVPVVRDSMSEEGEVFSPECESEDFSGSEIGSSGPVSPKYSVGEYLFGRIPLGNEFINVTFADLPGSALGQAGGDTIVLDSNGGAYGWFLDTSPWANEEFLPTSNPNEFIARAGSDAAGKMDLLTVLLHEYGHVLGLDHNPDLHDFMAEELQPGVRRTVSAESMDLIWDRLHDRMPSDPSSPFSPDLPFGLSAFLGFGFARRRIDAGDTGAQGISLPPLPPDPNAFVVTPSSVVDSSPQFQLATHSDVFNGDFAVANVESPDFGWRVTGDVSFDSGAAELRESERAMSGLSQSFVVPENVVALRFTIDAAQFAANGVAPSDAFEVALIDSVTGLPVAGVVPLSHSDSLLNLQSNGTLTTSSSVRVSGLPTSGGSLLSFDGKAMVTVNLSGVAAGSSLKLHFDLLGLGAKGSRVVIDDVKLLSTLNSEPTAVNDSATTAEDTSVDVAVVVNDVDADGDTLTPVLVTGPAFGAVTLLSDGRFRYTPNADFSGTDQFTYRVSDGDLQSNIATVQLTVTPVNDVPVAMNDAATTGEDQSVRIAVLANDTDVDSSALTAVIVDGPTHGSVVVNSDGTVDYTPNENFNGTDAFTYRTSDGTDVSNLATVTIVVTAVNDAPIVDDLARSVDEDGVLLLDLLSGASDVDGDTLSIASVGAPTYGRIEQDSSGAYRYVPNADFYGTDTVSFVVTDGVASTTATVTLTINPINDAPVAADDNVFATEDQPIQIHVLVNDSDVEQDALTPSVLTGPAHGSLTLNGDGSFTYVPGANYHGTDQFTYRVNDGAALSNVATVNITIAAVNDAPTAGNDVVTTAEDTAVTIAVLTNDGDVDGDALTPVVVAGPSHGTVTVNTDGTLTYTPDANFHGPDQFTYQVSDGQTTSNVATVDILVTPVNDAAVAMDDTARTAEDQAVVIDVLANDADIDTPSTALMPSVVDGPSHGVLSLNPDGTFTYTPEANFYGTDAFTYRVNDGESLSNLATVNIVITPVNDAPVTENDSVTTAEDTAVSIAVLANDSDVDGDSLTPEIVTGPTHGLVTVNADGTLSYTPTANFNGTDTFTYRVSDGSAQSDLASVTITVTPVNDAPLATEDAFTTDEDTALTFDVRTNDSDVDGDTLLPILVSGPSHGTLVLEANGAFTYRPDADYNGADQFTYRASDGSLTSNIATVQITVVAMNQAPTATASTVGGTEDTPYTFTWSDFHAHDVDSTTLSIVVTSLPADGELQYFNGTTWAAVTQGQTISKADIDAGSFCFGPDANESGFDGYTTAGVGNRAQDYARFTYRVSDGELASGETTMTVDIAPVADAPLVTFGNANSGIGGVAEVLRTSWESAPNRNTNSTVLPQTMLEGWAAVMPPGDNNNHFIVWSSGDKMKDAGNTKRTVYAASGNGSNWIELADANGAGHETIGISRSVTTRAGATYLLNFDYAGRLGYSTAYTKIGVYVDGVKIGEHAGTSPNTALNWQALSFSFTGTGSPQTIKIQIESVTASNGRGAMIDDIVLSEQQPLNSGYANSAIQLSRIAAMRVDTDGSETLSISLAAIPVGSTLSDGTRSFTATSGSTSLDITSWTLSSLRITPPINYTGTFDLVLTASAKEAASTSTAGTVAMLRVNVMQTMSPIVLDLDGDGIHTTALEMSSGKFDLLNTGVAIHSGWISAGDAFLAIDANRNGIIDDRSELFGGALGEGFAKLAEFDSNRDGRVDASDARFGELLVWQDANGNHRTDAGELRTLITAGVASLNVSYELKPEEQNGNWLYEQSSALLTNGQTIAMADAYLRVPSLNDRETQRSKASAASIIVESRMPQRAAVTLPPEPKHQDDRSLQAVASRYSQAALHNFNCTNEPAPTIDWSATKRHAVASDKPALRKPASTQSWVQEFLGVKRDEDLAKLTGLRVQIPEHSDRKPLQ